MFWYLGVCITTAGSITTADSMVRRTNVAEKHAKRATEKAAKKAAVSGDASKAGGEKRKYRLHPGTRALREIRKYQRGSGPLIPRATLARFVRELVQEARLTTAGKLRVSDKAFAILQYVSEDMLIQWLRDCNYIAVSNNRVTITQSDMDIVSRLSVKEPTMVPVFQVKRPAEPADKAEEEDDETDAEAASEGNQT